MKREPNERLKEARIRARYQSAAAAARAFGWPYEAYKKHESGGREFDSKTAQKYAKALATSAGWLLREEGEGPTLSDNELAVLAKFRLLDPPHQRAVLDLCDSLLTIKIDPDPTVISITRRRRKR